MTTIKRFNPDYKMHAARFEAFAREAEYGELVQFDDHQQTVSTLEAERDAQQKRADALEVRLRNALSSEQEAIQRAHATNQTIDALAVENAAMRSVIDAAIGVANNSSGIAGWHLNGEIADWDEILPELNIETPVTSAALAAIQAQAIEDAVKKVLFVDTVASTVVISQLLRAYAAALREAK